MNRSQNSIIVQGSTRVKKGDRNIKNHSTSKDSLLFFQEEPLLQNQKPFSYVLSKSKYRHQFAVRWVQKDGSIMESYFKYNSKTKIWFYRNGSPHRCKSFDELLSTIFHCPKKDLNPCNRVSKK